MECYSTTAESSESLEKTTVSSQNKPKRNDKEEESIEQKKAKMVDTRVDPEENKERRIWDIDSDAEEDF
jgi:hypothetical protein